MDFGGSLSVLLSELIDHLEISCGFFLVLNVLSNSDLGNESLSSESVLSDKSLDLGSLLSLLSILSHKSTTDDVLLDEGNSVGLLVTI